MALDCSLQELEFESSGKQVFPYISGSGCKVSGRNMEWSETIPYKYNTTSVLVYHLACNQYRIR